MFAKELPARPNIEQYKRQAKDLAYDYDLGNPEAFERARRHHPQFHNLPQTNPPAALLTLTDAQFVIAREHGFQSWQKFAKYIETIRLIHAFGHLADPVTAFIEFACVPLHAWHASGDLELAKMILARYPKVATATIHTAAILGDELTVRNSLRRDPSGATAKGGPHGWNALTYLCFSRYLRLDPARSQRFVAAAEALLDAGASARTGWFEMIDHPDARPTFESVIYGAAGIAQRAELTRLLLERGADPNDEETPYHVPESYDNTVAKVLLESGKLNAESLTTMLLRKTDIHDEKGLQLILEHGADPNAMTKFSDNSLHHALRRDNRLIMIEMLLDHAANPALINTRDGRSATQMAAHRGRGDVLRLFEQRGVALDLHGVDRLIAACAKNDREAIRSLTAQEPHLVDELLAQGGTRLAEFAGNDNVEGIRCLLDLGVSVAALYAEGDPYFDIAKDSTALHVAAWRGWPSAVKALIERGAPINALDAKGRTPLALAVKACVDSYWKNRRTPESVEALLLAGATVDGIAVPSGYEEVDDLLRRHATQP
jgi:ankyrin repeat protein